MYYYCYSDYNRRRRYTCHSNTIGNTTTRNNISTLFCPIAVLVAVVVFVIFLCQLPVSDSRSSSSSSSSSSRRIALSSSEVKINLRIPKIISMIQKHTTTSSSKTIQTKNHGKSAIETVLSIKNGGSTDATSTVAIINKQQQQQNTKDSSSSSSHTNNNNNISTIAIIYMILLSIQFGIQPIVTRKYTSTNIIRSSFVLIQEFVKLFIAFVLLLLTTSTSTKSLSTSGSNIQQQQSQQQSSLQTIVNGWNIQIWISVAFIPAILYLIQNIASLTAYQNLDAMTYNVLNQTKTLSAAFCCYLLIGIQQSPIQIVSLLILLVSALTIEGLLNFNSIFNFILSIFVIKESSTATTTTATADSSTNNIESIRHYTHGVFPLLLASFISGLAGAITQRSLQKGLSSSSSKEDSTSRSNSGRNIYLFSIELCVASIIILIISLLVSKDGKLIQQYGFWYGWDIGTIIPILTNSAGGILVGLVTKHAGSVQKGFALIFGILLSGILQSLLTINSSSASASSSTTGTSSAVKPEQWIGGILAGLSLYLHSSYPPKKKVPSFVNQSQKQQQKQQQSTVIRKIKPFKEE